MPEMKYDNYNNLPELDCPKTFAGKSPKIQKLIKESLQILSCLGIPIDEVTERKREKMGMAFLAVLEILAILAVLGWWLQWLI